MSDESRAISDWERKEELVLKTLVDLRMSSDASLKMAGELKEAFATLSAEVKGSLASQQRQIDELKERMDSAVRWALGIAGSVIVGVFVYLLNQLHLVAK